MLFTNEIWYKLIEFKSINKGGWTEVCTEADLKTEGRGYPIEEESLLEEFHEVALEMGKIPTCKQQTLRYCDFQPIVESNINRRLRE